MKKEVDKEQRWLLCNQKLCEVLHKHDNYFKDKNKKKLDWKDVAKEADLVNGK